MDRLLRTIEEKDQRAFVERVMAMGHESVLEHVSFTFLIEGVSRVLLAQLTRHRIASFSRATGLEALMGYLYLTGQTGRIAELFDIGAPIL